MKHIAQKYDVILSLVLLCTLCMFVQLDAQAYFALPMPGYSGWMAPPVFSPFSSGLFGAPYEGLFSLFATLPGVTSIYGPGIVLPGFDPGTVVASVDGSIQANPGGGGITQTNPGGDIQSPEWNDPGLSISPYGFGPYGFGNPLVPVGASGFPYLGLQYPAMGFFGMGFPVIGPSGIGLSGIGISGLGIPGMGFPGIDLPGMEIPGMGSLGTGFTNIGLPGMGPIGMVLPVTGMPWMWNPWTLFPLAGFPLPGYQGAYNLQTKNGPDNPVISIWNYLGNKLGEYSSEDLPDTISDLIPLLPVMPPADLPVPTVNLPLLPVDLPLQLASITSRMYVAATIKGTAQTTYILLEKEDEEDDDDSILSLDDIMNEGKYCIKVKNLPGKETSYEVECGENCYTVSLYLEIYSPRFIWAWDIKPW